MVQMQSAECSVQNGELSRNVEVRRWRQDAARTRRQDACATVKAAVMAGALSGEWEGNEAKRGGFNHGPDDRERTQIDTDEDGQAVKPQNTQNTRKGV
jgi:hypothetical protein